MALEFVHDLPERQAARFISVHADMHAPRSPCSKHPVKWRAMFVFHPPEMVVDGGEMFLEIDIETQSVRIWGE